MKALVLEKPDSWPVLKNIEIPAPGSNALVRIRASALNHRDVWIAKGRYPGIRYPVILGSDGCGDYQGKRVLINPSHRWGSSERVQGADYQILGLPENGTFAEYAVVHENCIHEIPPHLDYREAAALPLAGLTAFRALFTRAGLTKGDRVFIHGIGGGVALFALLFSVANGHEVYVSSGSEHKIETALEKGAKGGINYRMDRWAKTLLQKSGGGFDVILDGAGGPGFGELINLANPGARIAVYGGTAGNVPLLNPQQIFWKQISILGSTMGSDKDFKDMLEFVSTHRIRPVIDSTFSLDEGVGGFERMDRGLQVGKIVLLHG